MHLNCIYFFCILDYGIWKNFGLTTSGKILDSPIRNSKYAFHIQKIHHSKKAFWNHKSITEIYILDSEIHNSKKSIPNSPICNRIRLLDSAIRKSIIYAKFVSRTLTHPEKKMIQFWIDESIAHSQILISGNQGALFQIKGQGQFQDLENCEVQEEKCRGA